MEFAPGRDVPRRWSEAFDEIAGRLRGAPDAELAQRVYREFDWIRIPSTVVSLLNGVPTEVAVR
jgi:hypothetical protein